MTGEAKVEPPSAARETAAFWAGIAAVTLMAVLGVQLPLLAGIFVSPWIGVAASVGSLWLWGRFGPSPRRGYVSGIVCLAVGAGIIGSLVACVALGLRERLT